MIDAAAPTDGAAGQAAPTPAARGAVPADAGFRMPAEWARHRGTWMAWPERPDVWRDGAAPAREEFAAVAEVIAAHEPLTVTCSPGQVEACRAAMPPGTRVLPIPSDDAWMRDIGPTFLVDGRGGLGGVDWVFNAWGGHGAGLYASWDRDDAMAAAVCEAEGARRWRAPLVTEGGALATDGEGTLLVTEESLLDPNRNPGRSRAEVEGLLEAYLGVRRVVWLGLGLVDDETAGHVDNLAAFAAPGVVLLHWCDDPADPQQPRSADARRRLEAARDATGRPFEVQLLPHPAPMRITEAEAAGLRAVPGTKPRRAGDRLAASYVNAYPGNGFVLVPRLDPRTDDAAAAVWAEAFPDRQVVGVAARELLLGGGGIHCITCPVPDPAAAAGARPVTAAQAAQGGGEAGRRSSSAASTSASMAEASGP